MYLCCLNRWMFCCSHLAAGASVTLWHNAMFGCLGFFCCAQKSTLRFYKPFLQRGNWHNGNVFSEKVSHPDDLVLVFKERLSVKRFFTLAGILSIHVLLVWVLVVELGSVLCSPSSLLAESCNGSAICYQLVKFLWWCKVCFMISLQGKGGREDGLNWRVHLFKWK